MSGVDASHLLSQQDASAPILHSPEGPDLEELNPKIFQVEASTSGGSYVEDSLFEESEKPNVKVVVPEPSRRWEYQVYHEDVSVEEILEEEEDSEVVKFRAILSDGSEVKVSHCWE